MYAPTLQVTQNDIESLEDLVASMPQLSKRDMRLNKMSEARLDATATAAALRGKAAV